MRGIRLKTALRAASLGLAATIALWALAPEEERRKPPTIIAASKLAATGPATAAGAGAGDNPMPEAVLPAMNIDEYDCKDLWSELREQSEAVADKPGGADTEIAAALLGWRAADLARCSWPTPENMQAALNVESTARQAWARTGHMPAEPMKTADFDEVKECEQPPCGYRMSALRPPTADEIESQEKARPKQPSLSAQVALSLHGDTSERAQAWRAALGIRDEARRQ